MLLQRNNLIKKTKIIIKTHRLKNVNQQQKKTCLGIERQ